MVDSGSWGDEHSSAADEIIAYIVLRQVKWDRRRAKACRHEVVFEGRKEAAARCAGDITTNDSRRQLRDPCAVRARYSRALGTCLATVSFPLRLRADDSHVGNYRSALAALVR